MKKWLSRGLVLAMIVAMMIPTPVLAKSSSGGKLVKSVEDYNFNSDTGRWELDSKVTYKYDKKNNPSEIRTIEYTNHYLGIPTNAYEIVETAKYKYKGKSPKSATFKNTAGVVTYKATYKNGKPVYTTRTSNSSSFDEETKTEYVTNTTSATNVAFTKKGLAYAASGTRVSSSSKTGKTTTTVWSSTYAATQKKGVPSVIVEKTTTNSEGTVTEGDSTYTVFDGKGLAVNSGWVDPETGKYDPMFGVTYEMKKGNVATAVISYLDDEKGAWVPFKMIKFKYYKTKVSKVRYLNMINSIVDEVSDNDVVRGYFSWY